MSLILVSQLWAGCRSGSGIPNMPADTAYAVVSDDTDSIPDWLVDMNRRSAKFGIPIQESVFDSLVVKCSMAIKQGEKFTESDYVLAFRIDFTLRLNDLWNVKSIYGEFWELFHPDIRNAGLVALDLKSSGSSYYSKRFDLYWCGQPDSNSQFSIIRPSTDEE